jgi:type I restriction enzyme S subunit
LPHPRLAEQRAIADYLDAETARIDALIAKKQQLIHLLEERWETELTELLRLDGDLIALQRLFEPTIGGSWGSEPGTADKDAACVRGTDFDMRALRVAATCPKRSYTIGDFASKCLRPGDLVIEKSGGGENQPVGRAVLFDGSGPAVPTNFAARLRPRAGSVPDYLILLLNAAYRQGITRSWIKQTTGIQNLDLGGLLSEKVPLPSKTRQLELLVQLKQRDERRRSVVGQLSRQIDLLAEHRQTLITAAVTGQLSVPGAA